MNLPFGFDSRPLAVMSKALTVVAVITLVCGCAGPTEASSPTTTAAPASPSASVSEPVEINSEQLSSACSSVERSVPIIENPLLDLANGGGGTLSRVDRLALAGLAADLASLETGGSFAEETIKFVNAAGVALESDYIDSQTAADAFISLDKMRQLCGVPAPLEPSKA